MAAISSLPPPENLQAVTPLWFTQVLRERGWLLSSSVETIEVLPHSAGAGMTSAISWIKLAYDQPEADQPQKLVVKCMSDDPQIRALFDNFGVYRREAFFYNQFASLIQTRTPRCYYAGYAAESQRFMLILEDLSSYQPGSWVAGCSLEQAKLILQEAALYHAAYWNDPRLNQMEAIIQAGFIIAYGSETAYAQHWPAALEALGLDQDGEFSEICRLLEGVIAPAHLAITRPPITLNHLDLQLDNIFFGKQPNQAPFVLTDWALLAVCNPGYDLAIFLSSNLEPEIRKPHEAELLSGYLNKISEQGVHGYSLAACQRDYRAGLVVSFFRMIDAVFAQIPLTEKKTSEMRTLITRHLSTIKDNTAWKLE